MSPDPQRRREDHDSRWISRRGALVGLGLVGLSGTASACFEDQDTPRRTGRKVVIRPEDMGAFSDGRADDRDAIQRSLDSASASGGTVLVTRRHAVGSRLHARSNVTLRLGAEAVLERTFSGGPFIANEDMSSKIERFEISGSGALRGRDFSARGQVIFLYGDDLVLSGFTVDTYSGGQAVLIGGDRVRLRRLSVVNPENAFGVGGIRMFGGTDFVASGCHVVAGDDALQFTPIATEGHPLRDLSISESAYIGCTGGSSMARFAVVILSTSPPGSHTLSASITNVAFTRCRGFASRRAVVVANTDSTGEIGQVQVECDVDLSRSAPGNRHQEILVERAPETGSVHDLRFRKVRLIAPTTTSFASRGDLTTGAVIENVDLDECQFPPPRDGSATIRAFAVAGLRIRGGVIQGAGVDHVIKGGVGPDASRDVTITDATITGIASGRAGIRLPDTSGYTVTRSRFRPQPGESAATGISVGSLGRAGSIVGNDFTALDGKIVVGRVGDRTIIRGNSS